MTREEFLNNVRSIDEIIEMCYNFDYPDVVSNCNLYDKVGFRDYMDDMIRDKLEGDYWYEVRDWLQNIPDDADYYEVDGWDIYGYYNDNEVDFENIRDMVIRELDYNDVWDDEPDEYETTDESDTDSDIFDEEPSPVEDISLGELLGIAAYVES